MSKYKYPKPKRKVGPGKIVAGPRLINHRYLVAPFGCSAWTVVHNGSVNNAEKAALKFAVLTAHLRATGDRLCVREQPPFAELDHPGDPVADFILEVLDAEAPSFRVATVH